MDSTKELTVRENESEVTFEVHVSPRSKKNRIEKILDGVLYVKLSAPPVEDKANIQLCRMLSDLLGVKIKDVSIAVGGKSRKKVVRIRGISALLVKKILSRNVELSG